MTQARGRKAQLLFAEETSFSTDPTVVNAIKMPFVSSQIRSTQTLSDDEIIRNNRNPAIPDRGNIDVNGTVVVPVDEVAIGYWLKAMFGAPETDGDGDPYTHVFTPGDTQPSLVLEQGFTDIGVYEKFNGCKISRFSISFGGDAPLRANIDIMGAKETISATSLDADPTEIDLVKYNQFHGAIQEGGATVGNITGFDLTIEFNLDGDQYTIGSGGARSDIPEGILAVTGTIRAFFENATLLNKAIEGTESSIRMTLANGQNRSLEFYLPEVMYERNSPGIEGSRGILIELPYRAYYQNSLAGAAIVVTLKNGQATY